MTERLYLNDAYLTAFAARVVERLHLSPDDLPASLQVTQPDGSLPNLAVVLDRSAFLPGGAGIVATDRGTLNDIPLSAVFEDDKGRLLHVLPQDTWCDDVQGRVDWSRRLDLILHHTAQHILSEAFVQVAGAETVAWQVSAQTAWLELSQIVPEGQIERVEAWANQMVSANRAVRTAWVDPARLAMLPVRLAKPPSSNGRQQVRVVSVEGMPPFVCQMAHIARTAELGALRVARADRVNERLRVEFQCGARALAEWHTSRQLVARLAAMLRVGPADLEQAIFNLQAQTSQAASVMSGLRSRMLEYECLALEATAERNGDTRIVSRVFPDRDVAETRYLARMLCERANLVVLTGTAGNRAQLFFGCSPDVSHDMNMLMKAAAQVIGTQGSGQVRWAESLPVRADTARVEAALSKAAKLVQARR